MASISRRSVTLALGLAASLVASSLPAQASYPTSWDPALLRRADVRAAIAHVERGMPSHIDEWIRIAEMPGKSGSEAQRAAYVRQVMKPKACA